MKWDFRIDEKRSHLLSKATIRVAEIIENVGIVYRLLYQSFIGLKKQEIEHHAYNEVPVVVQ